MSLQFTSTASAIALGFSLALLAGCTTSKPESEECDCCHAPATQPTAPTTKPAAPATKPVADAGWTELFDGKSLTNWKPANYAGAGEPNVEDGVLLMPSGEGLTGVTWTGKALPKTNYELEVVAKRVDGVDFFCGITFPVNDTHASFIPGGWGGAVVGISNIDDEDAAHNETTVYEKFDKGKWYTLKVRVEPENITAWIDGKEVVDVSIKNKKVSIRGDIDQSTPLGLANWQTSSAVKSVRIRTLAVK